MKSNLLSRIAVLSLSFSLCFCILALRVEAQCGTCTGSCTYTNISTSLAGGWEKSFDIYDQDLDDVAWGFTAIDDDDADTKQDDGIVIVGTAKSTTTGYDVAILRLDMNGSLYTGGSWGSDGIITWNDDGNKEDAAYAVVQASGNNGDLYICGAARTKLTSTEARSKNVWVGRLETDGDFAWTKYYGSTTGNEAAYDIKEDLDGDDFILVGSATKEGTHVPSEVHTDGDYYVLKIEDDGDVIDYNVYYGDNDCGGNDYATSVAIDGVTGEYVVTGFCKSCDPISHVCDPPENPPVNSQVYLLKIPDEDISDETNTTKITDGNIDASKKDDFGSYSVIQTQETFGTFTSSDGFISAGLQHPGSTYDCFDGGTHNFWVIGTVNSLYGNSNFITSCIEGCYVQYDASTRDFGGGVYGGTKNDVGHGAAQTCDGMFLVAGITKSNNQVESCTFPDCQVCCNHYCSTPTEDIWLIKVNSSGTLQWSESIGTSGHDGVYKFGRLPDGSFLLVGYTPNGGVSDFYVVKFELTATCAKPVGLSTQVSGCGATVSWTVDPCVPSYILKYKKASSSIWTTVDPASSPYTFYNNTSSNANYVWTVQARCSPGNISDTAMRGIQNLSHCAKLSYQYNKDYISQLISVYPNPSSGAIKISIDLRRTIDEDIAILIIDLAERVLDSFNESISEGKLEKEISIAKLPAGLYFIQTTIAGVTYRSKVVKE
ncbi:MAG: T9SS type A sorting domain-containing protein [Chitinophagales bacterium]|nr:T9SS type A sorting domain-containing protein [Chitinophagales bacterium]